MKHRQALLSKAGHNRMFYMLSSDSRARYVEEFEDTILNDLAQFSSFSPAHVTRL